MPEFRLRSAALALLIGLALSAEAPAATNVALGSIGGNSGISLSNGDGSGTARITIDKVDLALVKQARDLDGAVLPANAAVTAGETLYFVLYIDNPTDFPADALTITDLLDESQFTYVAGSVETTTVASGADDAALWAGTWTALTDALGAPDDIASFTNSGGAPEADRFTAGAVSGQANTPLTIPPHTLRALRFRAKVD
jgi:uncharacterized repeat protein (TIGR01451 family)